MLKAIKNILSNTNKNEDTEARCPFCGGPLFSSDNSWLCVGRVTDSCNFSIPKFINGHKVEFEYINELANSKNFREHFLDIQEGAIREFFHKKATYNKKLPKTCFNCNSPLVKEGSSIKCSNKECGLEAPEYFRGVRFSDDERYELLKARVSHVRNFIDENNKNGERIRGRVLLKLDDNNKMMSEYLFFVNSNELPEKYFNIGYCKPQENNLPYVHLPKNYV